MGIMNSLIQFTGKLAGLVAYKLPDGRTAVRSQTTPKKISSRRRAELQVLRGNSQFGQASANAGLILQRLKALNIKPDTGSIGKLTGLITSMIKLSDHQVKPLPLEFSRYHHLLHGFQVRSRSQRNSLFFDLQKMQPVLHPEGLEITLNLNAKASSRTHTHYSVDLIYIALADQHFDRQLQKYTGTETAGHGLYGMAEGSMTAFNAPAETATYNFPFRASDLAGCSVLVFARVRVFDNRVGDMVELGHGEECVLVRGVFVDTSILNVGGV